LKGADSIDRRGRKLRRKKTVYLKSAKMTAEKQHRASNSTDSGEE
jgi:ribosome-associated protein YbcJ (S4-like RNA binding protein)